MDQVIGYFLHCYAVVKIKFARNFNKVLVNVKFGWKSQIKFFLPSFVSLERNF